MKKVLTLIPAMMVVMLVFVGIASAHVKVLPQKTVQGSYETFTVSVPSEKEKVKTVKVKVDIPKSVEVSRVEPMPNWDYSMKKDDSGKITSITWKASGEGLTPTEFTELKMKGKVSDKAESLRFKAYQTYSDDSVVKWVGSEDSDHPASVTKVSAQSMKATSMNDKADAGKTSGSNFSLYLSIAAIVLGIVAIIIAIMKRKKVS